MYIHIYTFACYRFWFCNTVVLRAIRIYHKFSHISSPLLSHCSFLISPANLKFLWLDAHSRRRYLIGTDRTGPPRTLPDVSFVFQSAVAEGGKKTGGTGEPFLCCCFISCNSQQMFDVRPIVRDVQIEPETPCVFFAEGLWCFNLRSGCFSCRSYSCNLELFLHLLSIVDWKRW